MRHTSAIKELQGQGRKVQCGFVCGQDHLCWVSFKASAPGQVRCSVLGSSSTAKATLL